MSQAIVIGGIEATRYYLLPQTRDSDFNRKRAYFRQRHWRGCSIHFVGNLEACYAALIDMDMTLAVHSPGFYPQHEGGLMLHFKNLATRRRAVKFLDDRRVRASGFVL